MNSFNFDFNQYVSDNVHVLPFENTNDDSLYYSSMHKNDRSYLRYIYATRYDKQWPTLEQLSKVKLLDTLPFYNSAPLTDNSWFNGSFSHTMTHFKPDFNGNEYLYGYLRDITPMIFKNWVFLPLSFNDHGFETDYEQRLYCGETQNFSEGWFEDLEYDEDESAYGQRVTYLYLENALVPALERLQLFHWIGLAFVYCNVAMFVQIKRLLQIINRDQNHRSIILSGDVEENPGPVCSKLRTSMRYNNPSIEATPRMLAQVLGLADASRGLEKLATVLEKVAPAFINLVDSDTSTFHREINNDLCKVNQMIDKVCETGNSISSSLTRAFLVSAICTALCVMGYHKTSIGVAVIALFKLYNLPAKAIEIAQQQLSRMRAQGPGDSTLISVGKVLLTGLSCILINRVPDEKEFTKLTKKLSGMGHALKGVKEMFSSVDSLWAVFKGQLEGMLWKESPCNFKSLHKRIQEWSSKIVKYSECNEMDKLIGDFETSNEIQRLYQEGLQLKQEVFQLRDKDLILHVQQFTTHAKSLYEYLSKTNVRGAGMRVVPYPIVVYGESGVGKSALSILLASDLLIALGHKPESAFHHMYARQSETEFWDGYNNNHDVIIYDDAFQRNDDASNPNVEVMEMIRSVNVFPQHLHMACLEDKNTYLTAKCIIYTMNNIHVQLKSIAHPEAFQRRLMENAWKVIPAPEYAKNVKESSGMERIFLDESKIEIKDALDDKVYNLVRMRLVNGEYVEEGPHLSYNDFIEKQIQGMKDSFTKWTNVGVSLHQRMSERYRMKSQVRGASATLDYLTSFLTPKEQISSVNPEGLDSEVNEEFVQARDFSFDDDTTYFGDIITNGIMKGVEMSDIEETILASDDADRYINWKLQVPSETFCQKWKRRAVEIYQSLSSSLKNWWNKIGVWYTNLMEKYPALKQFLRIGSIVVGAAAVFYACYSLNDYSLRPNFDEYLDHEMSEYEVDVVACKLVHQVDKGRMTEEEASKIWERVEWNIIGRKPLTYDNIYCEELVALRQEIASSGDKNTQRMSRMRTELMSSGSQPNPKAGKTTWVQRFKSEQVRDVGAYEMMMQAAKTSQYRLQIRLDGEIVDLGNVLALRGYNFVMPYHYLTYLRLQEVPLDTICQLNGTLNGTEMHARVIEFPLSEVVKEWGNVGSPIILHKAVRLQQLKSQQVVDGVVFALSENSKCHVHRNIVKHFISQEELGQLKGKMLGMLCTYSPDGEKCTLITKELVNIEMVTKEYEIDVENKGKIETYTECGGFSYQSHTMPGDCGGLLVLRAVAIPHKFLGYHISGCIDGGLSIKLTKEMIEDAFSRLEERVGYRAQVRFEVDSVKQSCTTPEGYFVPLGKAKYPLNQPIRSALEPSPIFGKITEPITKPAMLHPYKKDGVLVDPMLKGLAKCGGIPPYLDTEDLDMVQQNVRSVNDLQHNIFIDRKQLCRVMSYHEAIQGTDDPYIRSINRTTSPGYPYNADPKYRNNMAGKQYWMGKDENFDFTSPAALDLKLQVESLISDCEQGIIRGVICADTLKDERRPIAKVDEGKTRVFSACPMHYVVAFRQYFVGYAAWIMHNRIANESAVGINPYKEWDRLERQISKKGDSIIAGDFTNFDGTLSSQILWRIFGDVDLWYKRCETDNEYVINNRIRQGLWTHVVNSVHIFKDNLVMWTHSQPSGNPFTVIINTDYNKYIVRLAYLVACRNQELLQFATMRSFQKYVSMVAYGDDNLINISSYISSWFNQETISKAMLSLGHIYTEESKTGHSANIRHLNEVSFLKRSFRPNDDGGFDAALDINVIYEMINWVRRGYTDVYAALSQTVDSALREMTLHGKNAFDRFTGQLYSVGVNEFMTIYSYADYRNELKYSDWETNLNDSVRNALVFNGSI